MRMAVRMMRLPMIVEEVGVSPKSTIPKMMAKMISRVPNILPQVASRYLKPAITVRFAIKRAMA